MAVDAVVGIPGSGKSYWAVQEGIERWMRGFKRALTRHHRMLKAAGRYDQADPINNMPPVADYQGLACNFDMDKPALVRVLRKKYRLPHRVAVLMAASVGVVRSLQDLLDTWNCILLFDEAQLWFNARDFAYFPVEVLAFWTQHRKGGLDIILITQNIAMIDSNIRGIIANMFRARPVPVWFKMYRFLSYKIGLGADPKLPTFRYTNILDQSEGQVKNTSKGISEGMSRNSLVVLDPLVAACYRTTGTFYAPSAEIHKAAGSTKASIGEKLGLKYDLTRLKANVEGVKPQYPGLPVDDLAMAYRLDLEPGVLVGQLQREFYDGLVPLSRFAAEGGEREADGRDKTLVELPKENPPGETGGVGVRPRKYKGWPKRGAA